MMSFGSRLFVGFLLLALGAAPSVSVAAEGGDGPDSTYTAASVRALILHRGGIQGAGAATPAATSRRSTPLAFGLSAVVPGLGQAYNRQWIKAGVALAAEAALVLGYTTWKQKGNDGRDAYQATAHRSWSPIRYASWLNDYTLWLESTSGSPTGASGIVIPEELTGSGFDVTNPGSWSTAQQVAVRRLFDQIRLVESRVYHEETGAAFSHKLPFFGEQQYYELIGKYFQFAPGWDDYGSWTNEDGTIDETKIDPERTGEGGSKPNVSERFYTYARNHKKANDYLRRASRLSVFFIANHLLAAVDAAVFSKLHNDRLQARLTLEYDAFNEPVPGAVLRLTL